MNISFVILCYKTLNEVLECVSYIKKIELSEDINNISIVVVDNFSNDGTYERLINLFRDEKNIEVVSTEYNVGFAKGNNLGYSIAKYKFNADFIICLNSDVYIEDKLFAVNLLKYYRRYEFDIAGPCILTADGQYQNPIKNPLINDSQINKALIFNKMRYIKTYIPLIENIRKNEVKSERAKTDLENVCLHGACIIYSPRHIKRFAFAFYPDTFLYAEVDILFLIVNKFKLKTYYLDSLEVRHLEDCSLKAVSNSSKKRKRFVISHSIDSLKILKKLRRQIL